MPAGYKTAKVRAREDAQREYLKSEGLSAVRVLEELRRLAFLDLRGFFDEVGNLKPIRDLSPEQGAALAGLEVIKKNAEAGDGIIDTIHKFKVWDKTKALDSLAKHFGLLHESLDVTVKGDAAVLEALQFGRKRASDRG